QTSQWDDPW
nr:Chain C, Nef QW9 peptide from Protein Nef [Simian immunodeficiency virus]